MRSKFVKYVNTVEHCCGREGDTRAECITIVLVILPPSIWEGYQLYKTNPPVHVSMDFLAQGVWVTGI